MKRGVAIALGIYLIALAVGVLTPDLDQIARDPTLVRPGAIGLFADAVRNLVLFLPFGWLLGAGRLRPLASAGLGLALSLLIELAQGSVPGRFVSVLDVATNTLGTAFGALLHATRRRWLRPDPRLADRLAVASGILFAGVLIAGASLLRPTAGGPDYYGGLRPDLGQYDRFLGEVLEARLGATPIADGPMGATAALRHDLLEVAPVSIRARVGPPTDGLAPLAILLDGHQREILVVAAREDELLMSWRMRAVDFGLERPFLRWPGALRNRGPGDALALQIDRDATGASLSVGGTPIGRASWTAGRLWTLLVPAQRVPAAWLPGLDAAWIGLLALPCLFFARAGLATLAALAALLVASAWLGTLAPPGLPDGLGLLGGFLVARIGRGLLGPGEPSAGR